MTEMLLTFHCAVPDTEIIIEALRALSRVPIHITENTVRGWDFDDASTAEQVSGLLRRHTVQLIVEAQAVTTLVQAVTAAKRALPVRWNTVAVNERGRFA